MEPLAPVMPTTYRFNGSDLADPHPETVVVACRSAPRAGDRHRRAPPPEELDAARGAGEDVPSTAAAARNRHAMVDTRQTDVAHLAFEVRAVPARQPARMQPRVHHFVQHGVLEMAGMHGQQ